ncbi:MAG TPA: hypothetical protein VFI27_04420 [candidate division Zixibacteria bacterium]|nr:hypothetical protein [candidate division Zixibacteria bacterium]
MPRTNNDCLLVSINEASLPVNKGNRAAVETAEFFYCLLGYEVVCVDYAKEMGEFNSG